MDNSFIKKIISQSIEDHNKTFSFVNSVEFSENFRKSLKMIYETLQNDNCIISCGNGGSFSDAQHFSAELVVKYKRDRVPLSSFTLGCNTSILSACSNDYSYDETFKREYQAISKNNDTLIAISTSGNSPNIRRVIDYANQLERKWILLTSEKIKNEPLGGVVIKFPFTTTASIQESHIFFLQLICRAIDFLILGDE